MFFLFGSMIGINLLLGILGLIKSKVSIYSFSFSCFCFGISSWAFCLMMGWTSTETLFWAKGCFITTSFLPISLLLFVLNYPKKVMTFLSGHYLMICLLPFSMAFLAPTNLIIRGVDSQLNGIYGSLYPVFIFYVLSYSGAAIFILFRGFFCYTGVNKLKVRYLLYGFGLFVSFAIITALIFPLLGMSQYNKLGPLSSLFFVVCVFYAMLKHRLMDISLVINKILARVITIAFIFILYGMAIWISGHYAIGFESRTITIIIGFFGILISGLLFQDISTFIQDKTRQYFLKGQLSHMSIIEHTSQLLSKCVNLKDISGVIYRIFSSSFGVSFIYWVSLSEEETTCLLEYSEDESTLSLLETEHVLISYIRERKEVVFIEETEAQVRAYLEEHSIEVCLPCLNGDTVVSVVMLGSKLSGQGYTREDLNMLKVLSIQIGSTQERVRPFELIKENYERSLEWTEKLSQQVSLSTLTQGIAHEIRNPMAMLLSKSEWIEDRLDDREAIHSFLKVVKRNILRLIKITTTMLKYGDLSIVEKKESSIKELVEDVLLLTESECQNRSIDICHESTQDIYVQCIPEQLSHAILNIVINAMQSIEKKGSIHISFCEQSFFDDKGVSRSGVCLSIKDTGCGISNQNIKRVFDPFFSTKHENSGLGLSLVLKIMGEHNGRVDIESEPNEGTQFKLLLPKL